MDDIFKKFYENGGFLRGAIERIKLEYEEIEEL